MIPSVKRLSTREEELYKAQLTQLQAEVGCPCRAFPQNETRMGFTVTQEAELNKERLFQRQADVLARH